MKKLYILIVMVSSLVSWKNTVFAQVSGCFQLIPPYAELTDDIYTNCIETPVGVYHNDRQHSKDWKASESIDLSGIAPYIPTLFTPYNFQANILPSPFVISLLGANANAIELYGKAEFGIALPPNIASKVDNFVKQLSGPTINPYLEWEIKVQAHFFNGAITNIDGFYYKEYLENQPNSLPIPAGGDVDGYSAYQYTHDLGTWTEVPSSFPFRVRFSPPATGGWSVNFTITTPDTTFTTPYYDFTVVNTGKKPPIQIDPNNRFLVQNSETFIPSGCNLPDEEADLLFDPQLDAGIGNYPAHYRAEIAPPVFHELYRNKMSYLASQGGNAFRLLMFAPTSDIEFEHLGDYTKRLNLAWELDKMLEHAENLGLYIQWNMMIHYPLCTLLYADTFWDWKNNNNGITPSDTGYCYHREIATVNSVKDFLTDPTAIKYWKQRIRYIISRWGYSSNIMMFELMSEISNIGKEVDGDGNELFNPYPNDATFRDATYKWEMIMADYIKNELNYKSHLLSISYAGRPADPDEIYGDENIDVRSANIYDDNPHTVDFNYYRKATAFDNTLNNEGTYYAKPVIYSESGNLGVEGCDNHIETNRVIWKLLFSGLAMALNWSQNLHSDNWAIYGHVSQFMSGYNLAGGGFHPGNTQITNTPSIDWVEDSSFLDDMVRHDLKADLSYLRAADLYRAIGVLTNRTWNYYTGSSDACGIAPDAHYNTKEFVIPIPSSSADHAHNKLKVRGMKAKKYYIYYYDPANPTTSLPYGNDGYQTEWGPRLNLEYPILTYSMPFVLFKAVVKDNTINPEFVPNNTQGLKTEQNLNRDSVASNSVKANLTDTTIIQSKEANIKLYPNPNDGSFTLQLPADYSLGNVEISDVSGKTVYLGEIKEKRTTLHLNLMKGVYYLHFINKINSETLQFVVQ